MADPHSALAPYLDERADVGPRPLGAAGVARCHTLSDALDRSLRELTGDGDDVRFAVVAVGGYGRREQCRHSDIDVMLLVPRTGAEHATRVLYPLWDAGLKVGHSVRGLEEIPQAARNVETLTALLDARLVAGDASLFGELEVVLARVARSQRRGLREALAERHRALVAREPWQRQATDLKTGRGGLRELQFLHWLRRVEEWAEGPAGSSEVRLPEELAGVRERLLATRQGVHALAERPTDVFRDDLAPRVAHWLGEETMECARALYLGMRAVDEAVGEELGQAPVARPRWRVWRREGARAGRLETEAEPATDLEALRAALRGCADERAAVRLEPLPRAEWLDRLLPEWEALRARRHIAPFHVHPVDSHLLRTVAEAAYIARVDEEGARTVEVARDHGDLDELLLAAWLHDVGKGREEDHSTAGAVIAERFCARAGLDAETTQRLVTVVRHHLLLPSVATRRDIADARVIEEVAEAAGTTSTLRLLYLVAVADSRATGPDVWTAWRAQLMRSLFTRVLAVLQETGAVALDATRGLQQLQRALAGRFAPEAIESHIRQLEPGYLLSTPAETVGDHLELVAEAARSGLALRRERLNGMDRLTVVCPDRPGLLQALAGTLAAHQANVHGGVAYTRDDGVAIEVWHVGDALGYQIDDRRWGRILEAIPLVLDGSYPLEERLAEMRRLYPSPPSHIAPAVHVENAASDAYSVVEVTAQDRPGLLYAVTHVLSEQGIDIHLAKMDTLGPEAFDAFYVRRENGRRIEDPDEIERLEAHVLEAIGALERG